MDRHYIEQFLRRHSGDIRGRVLEIAEDRYASLCGRGVMSVDILHAQEGNPAATLVGDLTHEDTLPPDRFDCIILTQTLQYIFDSRTAVTNLYRALRPGGVVLASLPGISQLSRYDADRWGEYWRFTTRSAERLFGARFPDVAVSAHGNVLAAVAFLHGLAAEELRDDQLGHVDPDYELLITVRAVKPNDVARGTES